MVLFILLFEHALQETLYSNKFSLESKNDLDTLAKELITTVKKEEEFEQRWIKVAKERYGVTVTMKELDKYIEEGPNQSTLEEHFNYAEAMDMSLQELNEYDRDLYKKNLIWEKLFPILSDKYDLSDEDFKDKVTTKDTPVEELNLNNKLLALYNKEVSNYRN